MILPLLLPLCAHATEGMWLPEQLPELAPALAEQGLEVDPARLADPLADPLGAIVSLGYCSASFVSGDGLMVTNHHCVGGMLEYLSSGEENRYRDGYRAPTRQDELWVGPTGKVWVVESITDVTEEALQGIKRRTTDAQRRELVDRNEKALVAACEAARPNRRCHVDRYDGGGSFRLVDALELKDVRMVYAEPYAVGQFGGDVDNWMWPRQGADFAFLRAYVAPDGSSAPFAEENVPYHPAHVLPVQPAGVSPGDFAMIAGYPGHTNRQQTAARLRWEVEEGLATKAELMAGVDEILHHHADRDAEAAARLGASINGVENGLKLYRGELEAFGASDALARKEADEQAMRAWVAADRSRQARWGADLAAYDALVAEGLALQGRGRVPSYMVWSSDLLSAAHTALRNAQEASKPDMERDKGYQQRDRERLEAGLKRFERSHHLPSERELLAYFLGRYQQLPADQQIAALDALLAEWGGVEPALERLYTDPALLDEGYRLGLLDAELATLTASQDPWLRLAAALESFLGEERATAKAREGAALRLVPAWYAIRRAWATEQGRPFYQDANSSLRLTWGHVQGYAPENGLLALPQTTLAGLAAKAGPAPFDIPADLVADALTGPSHPSADPRLGDVPVNFLADLDITGGNSGSAVMNGRGELVGLAFDGVWESIASDWVYQDAVNRCISVDSRYMLWLLERSEAGRRVRAELGLE
ncbi:MAG: S46 family peptidase [Deltaproteobacteria bacterium]|nr:S46 family peptidase [Deltaproteobacteria bacterium]